MNRETLRAILKSQISYTYGINFNQLIDAIFFIIYKDKYISVKQKRDLGCDGIIESTKICLACYAPETFNKRKFKEKVNEDFEKYEKNYKPLGYKWRFMTNKELLGSMITYIKDKDVDNEIWGLNELINFILNLRPSARREVLLEAFQLSPELIEYDIIEEIIEEIMKLEENNSVQVLPKYELVDDIFEKIEINFTGEDIEIVKRKFKFEHVGYLEKSLKNFGDKYTNGLKFKILREYQILSDSLTFKEKLYELINKFSSKYPNDDDYKNKVELILLYLFEQCLIGEKSGQGGKYGTTRT